MSAGRSLGRTPSGSACTVVVPTYDAAATLGETLAALAAQTGAPPFEVVVADNGSTDASADVARGWADRLDLRVVDASRARGVAAARNDGIAAAGTETILICDADDVADPGWVAAMTRALQHHSFVGGALDVRAINDADTRRWVPVEPITTALPTTWGDRPYAFGGNMGMRRQVWADVGGFDESYGAGAEEIDFAWRAADAGHPPAFVPDAVMHYRLRSGLRGVLRQQHHSGLGTAHLFATFRPDVPTRRWHRRVRHAARLLARFPLRGGRVARGAWLSALAFESGMWRGARRHGIDVP